MGTAVTERDGTAPAVADSLTNGMVSADSAASEIEPQRFHGSRPAGKPTGSGWTVTRRGLSGAVAVAVVLAGAGCSADEVTPSQPRTRATPLVFTPHPTAATPTRSFGAGSYVVGSDVEPGRYSAGAGITGCQWIQRDRTGEVLDRDGVDRPTPVLTLATAGSQLVVAGDLCRFELLP